MHQAISFTRSNLALGRRLLAIAPLLMLPPLAHLALAHAPPWQWMWGMALAVYGGCKGLTCVRAFPLARPAWPRVLAYLFAWPGMDAAAFFAPRAVVVRPRLAEWLLAFAKLTLGLATLYLVVPQFPFPNALLRGWTALGGLVLVLHFGLFHLLSLVWRSRGIQAEPIMNWPILATSLGDFWGRRWNLAFRDLAFKQLLRSVVRFTGVPLGTMLVFLVSGLVHDLVISAPVGRPWGGPTLYFILQGAGLLIERSAWGADLGLGHGWRGALTAALVVLFPLAWLFPLSFLEGVVLPTLAALGVDVR